jgi:hypothetical protein
MKLSSQELLLFAELWSAMHVPARKAAAIMQTTIARKQRNRFKGKKRTRAAVRGR